MKKFMLLILVVALFASGCVLKKPQSFGCCQLNDPNSATPRCSALKGEISSGAFLEESRNCNREGGICEVRIKLVYDIGLDNQYNTPDDQYTFAKTTTTDADGNEVETEWIPVPICSTPASPCITGDCRAQACGAYKYFPTPIPSYGDYVKFKDNDAKKGEIGGTKSITEGSPEGLYGTKCRLVNTDQDLAIFLKRSKGAFVNTLRFGVGDSFQQFEDYRFLFPFSDSYCNVNPYPGTKDRYQNYLLKPSEFEEKTRNQLEFEKKVRGEESTIRFNLPWVNMHCPFLNPPADWDASPYLSGTYDGWSQAGNYKFSQRTMDESTIAYRASSTPPWQYTKLADYKYYEMDKDFYLNFIRLIYDKELNEGLNSEAGPLPAPFECSNVLECASGNCNYQDYLRAVCFTSDPAEGGPKWVSCQCMQESRACFGGNIFIKYLNDRKPENAADLKEHFDAYVNGYIDEQGVRRAVNFYYQKIPKQINLYKISINPDCTWDGSATGDIDGYDVVNTNCLIYDTKDRAAYCSNENLDARYAISCKPRVGAVLSNSSEETIFRPAAFEPVAYPLPSNASDKFRFETPVYPSVPGEKQQTLPVALFSPNPKQQKEEKKVSFQAPPPPLCPNAVCDPGETYFTCAADCPAVCSNSICEAPAENALNCDADCDPIAGNGICETPYERYPTDGCPPICGQYGCEAPAETSASCLLDCPDDRFAPTGSIAGVSQIGIVTGSSSDADNGAVFPVNFYVDGSFAGSANSNDFWFWIPPGFRDGANHVLTARAFGVDSAGRGPPFTKFGEVTFNSWNFNLKSTTGFLEAIDGNGDATGWAADTDVPPQSIRVHFYFDCVPGPCIDGNRDDPDVPGDGPILADIATPAVNTLTRNNLGGRYGFRYTIPNTFRDDNPHTLSAFGIDTSGTEYELFSPTVFTFPKAGRFECRKLVYKNGKPQEVTEPKTDPGPPPETKEPVAFCDFNTGIQRMSCDWKSTNGIDRRVYNDCVRREGPDIPFADGIPRYFCDQRDAAPPGPVEKIDLGDKINLFSHDVKFFGRVDNGAIGYSQISEKEFTTTDFYTKCKLTPANYVIIGYEKDEGDAGYVPNSVDDYRSNENNWLVTSNMWSLPEPYNNINELKFILQGWAEYGGGECDFWSPDEYKHGLIARNIIMVKPNADGRKIGICDLDPNTKVPKTKAYGWCEGCTYSTLAKQAITTTPGRLYSSSPLRYVYNAYSGGLNNSKTGPLCTPNRSPSGANSLSCPTSDASTSANGDKLYPLNDFNTVQDAMYLQEKQQEFLKQNVFPVIDLSDPSAWSGNTLNARNAVVKNGPAIIIVENVTAPATNADSALFARIEARLASARNYCTNCLLGVRFKGSGAVNRVSGRYPSERMSERTAEILARVANFNSYAGGRAMGYVDVVAFEFYPSEISRDFPDTCIYDAGARATANDEIRTENVRASLERVAKDISVNYGKVSLADPFTIYADPMVACPPGPPCAPVSSLCPQAWYKGWIQRSLSYVLLKQKTLSRAGLMGIMWGDSQGSFFDSNLQSGAFCPVVEASFNAVADEPITVFNKIYVQNQEDALCTICSDLDVSLGKCSKECATGVECAIPPLADLQAVVKQFNLADTEQAKGFLKCPPNTLAVATGQQCRQCSSVAGERYGCTFTYSDGTSDSRIVTLAELSEEPVTPQKQAMIASIPAENLCCLNDDNGDFTYVKQVTNGKITAPIIFSRTADPNQDCGVSDLGSINPSLCGISTPVQNYLVTCRKCDPLSPPGECSRF